MVLRSLLKVRPLAQLLHLRNNGMSMWTTNARRNANEPSPPRGGEGFALRPNIHKRLVRWVRNLIPTKKH
jgi:hypothetical protein